MISASTGDGVDHLRGWLLLRAQPREWEAAASVTHVQPPLTRATEIIREAIFTYDQQPPSPAARPPAQLEPYSRLPCTDILSASCPT